MSIQYKHKIPFFLISGAEQTAEEIAAKAEAERKAAEEAAEAAAAAAETETISKAELEELRNKARRAEDIIASASLAAIRNVPQPPKPLEPEMSDEDFATDFIRNPRKHLRILEEHITGTLTKAYTEDQRNQQVRGLFYESYPDLKKHELLVYTISQEVERELGPDRPLSDKMTEVAKRTREYLADIARESAESPNPPAVAGSRGARREVPRKEPPKPRTPEEIAAQYLRDRADRLYKQRRG